MQSNGLIPISVSIATASQISGLSRSRLYEELAAGRIDAVKHGVQTLILAGSLRRYVESLPRATFRIRAGNLSNLDQQAAA